VVEKKHVAAAMERRGGKGLGGGRPRLKTRQGRGARVVFNVPRDPLAGELWQRSKKLLLDQQAWEREARGRRRG